MLTKVVEGDGDIFFTFLPAGKTGDFNFISKEVIFESWHSKIGKSLNGFTILDVTIDDEKDGVNITLLNKERRQWFDY